MLPPEEAGERERGGLTREGISLGSLQQLQLQRKLQLQRSSCQGQPTSELREEGGAGG